MIKFENVGYGGFSNVSFEAASGSVCKILLRSTEARVEFLSLLTGHKTPDSGKVYVMGTDIAGLSFKEKLGVAKTLAIASAELAFISNLSIMENITLPVRYHKGLKAGEIETLLVGFYEGLGLDREGLRACVSMMPYSFGDKNKHIAALLRALLMDCPVIVYDKIFAGLTSETTKKMAALTLDYHTRLTGRTSLYITSGEDTLREITGCVAYKQTEDGFIKWTS
jgi:phospholipid/cholesterol/gamma-HCH transport system ATP-binding protein